MNNRTMRKLLAAGAVTAVSLAGLAACSPSDAGSEGGDVTMTFWHNSTTGAGKAFWDSTVADFEEANPGVTIKTQSIQNEEMDGKLQTALNSGDAPDIFMARGGGKLADVVAAGQAMDITDLIDDETRAAVPEGVLSAFAIDGKIYGMPTAVLPGGIYYSGDLFAEAGIEETPATLDELGDAVDKLKGAGVDPIAVGAKDAWPAAHWYYFFAVRACSQDTLNTAAETMKFDDPCWLEAGQNLSDFVDTEPFNNGFLTTSAQQGAGSSAGLLANKQAAMELMGAWNPGVIASLTPDEKPLPDLGWFPFPEVDGGEGEPGAMMGGVDGFTCSAEAPQEECSAFLNFFMQKEYQEGYAEAFQTIPANQDAQEVVEDEALLAIIESYNEAPYVTVWLDTLFGQNVGNALNTGVVDLFAGQGSAEDIVSAVADAAAKG
ncbi:extracellular solute-binding protein [Mycetocola manganoxydans]|uniref:Extracellular solute-binding protein n=2 Tax=Mycetocola manganoxydans TaxID=699879 RepID=A0A3L6ZKV8_9MICO|nr:extracellular solute-binding protein [Mycetocola manganoxydans]